MRSQPKGGFVQNEEENSRQLGGNSRRFCPADLRLQPRSLKPISGG
jgi:hypothetical protein